LAIALVLLSLSDLPSFHSGDGPQRNSKRRFPSDLLHLNPFVPALLFNAVLFAAAMKLSRKEELWAASKPIGYNEDRSNTTD